jgi:hypothetical protein
MAQWDDMCGQLRTQADSSAGSGLLVAQPAQPWWPLRSAGRRENGLVTQEPVPLAREVYVVDTDIVDRGEAVRVCSAVLDLVRPHAALAVVDGYSDYRGRLPPEVQRAQDWVRARGRRRGTGDPGMGVELDPQNAEDWRQLRIYAAWSIHVEVQGEGDHGDELAVLHDCGNSITAALTAPEAARLAADLGDAAGLLRVTDRSGPTGELPTDISGQRCGSASVAPDARAADRAGG